MGRCPTTPPSASAAGTACSRVRGTCRPRNGTRSPRRSKSARTAPIEHLPARADRVQRASRHPRTRPNGSSRRSRPRRASRRAPRTPCVTEPATRCSLSPTSASRTARTSTSTTSTARRRSAARPCCTSRRCLSRSSGSRRTGRSRFRSSRRRRSGPCLRPSWRSARRSAPSTPSSRNARTRSRAPTVTVTTWSSSPSARSS